MTLSVVWWAETSAGQLLTSTAFTGETLVHHGLDGRACHHPDAISGWAAFIAATMTGILNENEVTEYSGYEAFLRSIPTNYYAITAILFVFAVAYFGLNFGPMRKHERRAVEEGALFDASHGPVPGEADRNLPTREDGKVSDLVLPVATLIGVTVVLALWIGISNT
jgi:tetracycline resistance efflux pump